MLLFSDLRVKEESFYKQKSRVQWLKEGDGNTRFFHQYVKTRENKKRITQVVSDTGELIQQQQLVYQHFVNSF